MERFWPVSSPSSLILLGVIRVACEASVAPAQRRPETVQAEIAAFLQAQEQAWNQGDIDSFMNAYMRSSKTVFVSGNGMIRGWKTVYERYRHKYGNRAKMGKLVFSNFQVNRLTNDSAVAFGQWDLKRTGDNAHGYFTLIFHKTRDGWRIVHDHTSEARWASRRLLQPLQ